MSNTSSKEGSPTDSLGVPTDNGVRGHVSHDGYFGFETALLLANEDSDATYNLERVGL